MTEKDVVERAVIAGAAYAIRYREEHPSAQEGEIMKSIVKELKKIIDGIDR